MCRDIFLKNWNSRCKLFSPKTKTKPKPWSNQRSWRIKDAFNLRTTAQPHSTVQFPKLLALKRLTWSKNQMRRVYLAKIFTLTETHNKEIEREQSCKKMDYHCNGLFHQFRSWTNKIDKKISTQNYTLPFLNYCEKRLASIYSRTNVKSRIFF